MITTFADQSVRHADAGVEQDVSGALPGGGGGAVIKVAVAGNAKK